MLTHFTLNYYVHYLVHLYSPQQFFFLSLFLWMHPCLLFTWAHHLYAFLYLFRPQPPYLFNIYSSFSHYLMLCCCHISFYLDFKFFLILICFCTSARIIYCYFNIPTSPEENSSGSPLPLGWRHTSFAWLSRSAVTCPWLPFSVLLPAPLSS